MFERFVFRSGGPNDIGRAPQTRAGDPDVQDGKGGQANHRCLTSHSKLREMLLEG
jgi:hypothetical protein